jgi:hypothetical protein
MDEAFSREAEEENGPDLYTEKYCGEILTQYVREFTVLHIDVSDWTCRGTVDPSGYS